LLQLSNQSKVTGHTTTMTAKGSQLAGWSLGLRIPALVGKHVLGLRKGSGKKSEVIRAVPPEVRSFPPSQMLLGKLPRRP